MMISANISSIDSPEELAVRARDRPALAEGPAASLVAWLLRSARSPSSLAAGVVHALPGEAEQHAASARAR